MRRELPAVRTGWRTAFETALFLIHDEGLSTASGLAARPGDYPWQAQGRGFVAHLAYGLVLETARWISGPADCRHRGGAARGIGRAQPEGFEGTGMALVDPCTAALRSG